MVGLQFRLHDRRDLSSAVLSRGESTAGEVAGLAGAVEGRGGEDGEAAKDGGGFECGGHCWVLCCGGWFGLGMR